MRTQQRIAITGAVLALLVASAAEAEDGPRHETVTFINALVSADGQSRIAKESLGECVAALPSRPELHAIVTPTEAYLRDIGAVEGNAGYRTVYDATLDLEYLIRERDLVIVVTNAVIDSAPQFKEVERLTPRAVRFASNPAEGDLLVWRDGRRTRVFTTAEAAEASALRRAEAWLRSKRAVLCPAA